LLTCFIRYTINPNKLEDFAHYARVWMPLIEKYGGTHLGYFVPDKEAPPATFSFPGVGEAGPDNVAIALSVFPTSKPTKHIVATLQTIRNAKLSLLTTRKQSASLNTNARSWRP
jgi:hypothetical protein